MHSSWRYGKRPTPSAPADSFFRHTPQPICWLDGAGRLRLAATTQVFDDLFRAASPGTSFAAVAAALQPPVGEPAWDKFWPGLPNASGAWCRSSR